jgi:hypothetical protein
VDFVGIQETKKEDFSPSFLKNLTGPASFCWNFLPARGSAGGILVGSRDESILVNDVCLHTFSVCFIMQDKKYNFG